MKDSPRLSGEHRAVLYHEFLQGTIVVIVVAAASVIDVVSPKTISGDLLSFVYGAAISYAGGRANNARQALRRSGDVNADT